MVTPLNEESMKQIYNILNIAALVLAGALTTGCTDQLNDPQQPQDGGKTDICAGSPAAVQDFLREIRG